LRLAEDRRIPAKQWLSNNKGDLNIMDANHLIVNKVLRVGASGERLRSALKVVDAVTNGRSLWIATCNSIGALPPELRRRFTLGTFFFDLPSPDERAAIWKIYTDKYGVSGELPDDDGWTGAEIKECCRKAHRLKLTLKESAEYIVPVSGSAADQVRPV
jgi:SpoVK/Ycf46/Vps4 family AAA+-type ATPase